MCLIIFEEKAEIQDQHPLSLNLLGPIDLWSLLENCIETFNGPWWLWDALTEYLQEVELLLDVVLLQDVELLQDLDNLQDVELAQDLELAVNFFSSVSDNPKDFFNELWYQKSPQKDFYI